ncbi:hypothetical protein AGJ33_20040 [Cronobacter dublinensis subsp. dublinensis]|nr:hypothetical protein [Cronobacter dublinensis subsp. dublinensis]
MFTISKKTFDMAVKRGFELTIEEGATVDGSLLLCFWEQGEESEWLFSYQHTGNQLVWRGNVYAPKHIVSQLPKVLDSETELRDLIRMLGGMVSPKYHAAMKRRVQAALSSDHNYICAHMSGSYATERTWIERERRGMMGGAPRLDSTSYFY